MNINSTPKQVPTNFNGMLKIKHLTRVTNMVKGLEVAENASETLIDPVESNLLFNAFQRIASQ